MSIELKRNGLVAKILTLGMTDWDREKYLSSPQNICPMFWRFIFKIVGFVLWWVSMLFAGLLAIGLLCAMVSYLSSLTLLGGLKVSLVWLGIVAIAIAATALIIIAGFYIGLGVTDIFDLIRSKKQIQPIRELKSEVVQLMTSFTEAKKSKFCSAVTFE